MESVTATIDLHNRLFLHPADTPCINLISAQLIGIGIYGIWSRAMLIALRAKNKLAFIDGSSRQPVDNAILLPIWERCNAIVLSWILNSVSKEIFGGIIYSTDAEQVWKDLKNGLTKSMDHRVLRYIVILEGLHRVTTLFLPIFLSCDNCGMNIHH